MFKVDKAFLNDWVEVAQRKVSGIEFHSGIVRGKKEDPVTVGIRDCRRRYDRREDWRELRPLSRRGEIKISADNTVDNFVHKRKTGYRPTPLKWLPTDVTHHVRYVWHPKVVFTNKASCSSLYFLE